MLEKKNLKFFFKKKYRKILEKVGPKGPTVRVAIFSSVNDIVCPLTINWGCSSKEYIVLYFVLHFLLRVDEAGSEGAAATAIFMSRMLFIPEVRREAWTQEIVHLRLLQTTISVERTFLLSVVHKPSRSVIFAGKVDTPGNVRN